LLPGGLEPCGCFAVVAEAKAKELAPRVVPALRGIKDPLVLTIDSGTRKLSFWQHSGSGGKPTMQPAQVKADSHSDALMLWCAMPVDIAVPLRPGIGNNAATLVEDVERELADKLCSATAAVAASGFGEAMRTVDSSSEAKVAAVVEKGSGFLRAVFLRSGLGLVVAPNPKDLAVQRQRSLIVATALVLRPAATELRHAVEVLRRDLISSAGQRTLLALEEEEEDRGARKDEHIMLPWRALLRPKGTELPLWFGDYCMFDEHAGNAAVRIGELLGLPASDLERAPDDLDEQYRFKRDFLGTYKPMPVTKDLYDQLRDGEDVEETKQMNMCQLVCLLIASIFLALITGFLHYLSA